MMKRTVKFWLVIVFFSLLFVACVIEEKDTDSLYGDTEAADEPEILDSEVSEPLSEMAATDEVLYDAASLAREFSSVVYTNPDGKLGRHGSFPLNFGPTGAWGYMFNNALYVNFISPQSPADGVLQVGDVIIGANGLLFPRGFDRAQITRGIARKALGLAIEYSEAGDGVLDLVVVRKGKAYSAPVQLQQIGSSDGNWSGSVKSERILDLACRYAINKGKDFLASDVLLLMASGIPEYQEFAYEKIRNYGAPNVWYENPYNWKPAYKLIAQCEYYLRTGDTSVLADIQQGATRLVVGQSDNGSWSHRPTYEGGRGYGPVNMVGLVCCLAMQLAKECGVQVDEQWDREFGTSVRRTLDEAINKSLDFFKRYQYGGGVPYGDHLPANGNSNGKDGIAATVFGVAGEDQIASRFAESICHKWQGRELGHALSTFTMMWSPIGALNAPAADYQFFMNSQNWLYNVLRTADGGFNFHSVAHSGKHGYNLPANANGMLGLAYASHLKNLRILGKPAHTPGQGPALNAPSVRWDGEVQYLEVPTQARWENIYAYDDIDWTTLVDASGNFTAKTWLTDQSFDRSLENRFAPQTLPPARIVKFAEVDFNDDSWEYGTGSSYTNSSLLKAKDWGEAMVRSSFNLSSIDYNALSIKLTAAGRVAVYLNGHRVLYADQATNSTNRVRYDLAPQTNSLLRIGKNVLTTYIVSQQTKLNHTGKGDTMLLAGNSNQVQSEIANGPALTAIDVSEFKTMAVTEPESPDTVADIQLFDSLSLDTLQEYAALPGSHRQMLISYEMAMRKEAARGYFSSMLQDSNYHVRMTALFGLIFQATELNMFQTDLAPQIAELIQNDPVPNVRMKAATYLGSIKNNNDPVVDEALLTATEDPEWWVRSAAATGLLQRKNIITDKELMYTAALNTLNFHDSHYSVYRASLPLLVASGLTDRQEELIPILTDWFWNAPISMFSHRAVPPAAGILEDFGPDAAPAVDALIHAFNKLYRKMDDDIAIANCLGAIGAAAEPALASLRAQLQEWEQINNPPTWIVNGMEAVSSAIATIEAQLP
ncbi:MAG: hypothetical protein GY874_03745 [Desulfobacteraceae bacterium]|nr:hypothetical protein [Desulfobacteraceae bacterium]